MYLISFVSTTTVVHLADGKADLQRPKDRLTVTRAICDLGASPGTLGFQVGRFSTPCHNASHP